MVYAPARAIVRLVLIIVAVAAGLYLIFLLRKPIGWIMIALFLALALGPVVGRLERRMPRGFAIAVTYFGLLTVPILLGLLIVPPFVREANNLADDAPKYARDVTNFVEKNKTLRKLNKDYHVTDKLQKEAGKLPSKLGGAAKTLSDVGVTLVNSIFALVTILILTAFMLGSGMSWVARLLELQPPERRVRLERSLTNIGRAVSGYVAGALLQATVAGVLTYLVLLILGVPFAAPLAVIVFFFDLIPLVGATIAAVLVGIVTLFNDFPTVTIIWVIWSIIYQQVENSLIQPQIQRRTVDVHPFIVIVAVLCGANLIGIIGALVAIPVAASIQILLREYWDFRQMGVKSDPTQPLPPEAGEAAPA